MNIESQYRIPCPKCGATDFKYNEPLEDDSFVECTTCGFATILADIKNHGLEKAKEQLTKQVKDQLKKDFRKIFK